MSAFDFAVKFVLDHEGGLVDDPDDPGGLTNYGISLRFAETVELTADDIRHMTRKQAAGIYYRHFWIRIKGDLLPPDVALMAFDAAVNQGVHAATEMLQRAAGVATDGLIGPVTTVAAKKPDVLRNLAVERLMRYSRTRNFDRFGRGWYNRVTDAVIAAR